MADELAFTMMVDQNIKLVLNVDSVDSLKLYQQACDEVNDMLHRFRNREDDAYSKMSREKLLALVAFNFALSTIKENAIQESTDNRLSQMVKDLDGFLESNK